MIPHARSLGCTSRPQAPHLLILHGLLGSSDNWQTLGKRYAETHHVWMLDARNHGKSAHDDVHTYAAMGQDVLDFMDHQGISKARILGHSMGGKTVMHFGDRHPARCRKLIIADVAPIAYPPHHTPLFDALSAIDLTRFDRRQEVDAALAGTIQEPGIRQFLLKGLHRAAPDRFAWRYNLPVLRRHLADMTAFLPLGTVDLPTLALYGTRSDYVVGRGLKALNAHFPQLEATGLEAGHWLHAEQPDAFAQRVEAFLS